MKFIFFLLAILCGIATKAQVILNNAFVKAKMEIYSGSNGNVTAPAGGITDIEIYLKDTMSKVNRGNPNFKSIAIMNMNSDVSTFLNESISGEKTGFTYTALDKQTQKRKADSISRMQQENIGGEDGTFKRSVATGINALKNILYVEDLKTINGIECKKAIITIENIDREESKIPVWYSPLYIIPKGVGGERGMMSFDGLKGMPIYYESVKTISVASTEMSLVTIYQVTEIKTPVIIEDSAFHVPLGYTLKTYTEWENENSTRNKKVN